MNKKSIATLIAVIAISIIAFIGSIFIHSCEPTDNSLCPEIVESSTYIEVKPLEYKGHEYLWFRSKLRKGFGGVIHNPDCQCNNK